MANMGTELGATTTVFPGAEVLPYRSNIPKIAEFTLRGADPSMRSVRWKQKRQAVTQVA